MPLRLTAERVYVFTKTPDGGDCLAGELSSAGAQGTFNLETSFDHPSLRSSGF
ncbi:MAG: hypothetical protein RL497_1234 [Pseudomonadota bacterium]|jgi:hypothetical protein